MCQQPILHSYRKTSCFCCHTLIESRACHCFEPEVLATVDCQDIFNSLSGCCLWASEDIGDVTRHPLISAHRPEQTGISVNWHLLLNIWHKQRQQAIIIQLRILLFMRAWPMWLSIVFSPCVCCIQSTASSIRELRDATGHLSFAILRYICT